MKYIGVSPIEIGLSVGVAIIIMQLSETLHPPVVGPSLIMVMGDISWGFLLIPVLSVTIMLVLIAVFFQ